MAVEKLARQEADDFWVGEARADAGVGDAVRFGKSFGDVVFGAEAELDEDFA